MIVRIVVGFLGYVLGLCIGYWAGYDMGRENGIDVAFKTIGEKLLEEWDKDLEEWGES